MDNVFAQRQIIFTHRLILDESNSCPSRPTVLYMWHYKFQNIGKTVLTTPCFFHFKMLSKIVNIKW